MNKPARTQIKISFMVDKIDWGNLQLLADKNRTKKSHEMREALRIYLESNTKKGILC